MSSRFSTEPVPNVLYKFRDWNNPDHRRMLYNQEIYFSEPYSFNDPFDSRIPVRWDLMTDEDVFKKNLEIVQIFHSHLPLEDQHTMANELMASKKFWHKAMLRKEPDAEMDKWNSIIGLFTLSATKQNILLWSHYANCHTGFAVGFWSDSLMNDYDFDYCDAVQYCSAYPIITGMDDFESQFRKRFFSKSDMWSYEIEWRITKNHIKNRRKTIAKKAYAEVIIGCLAHDQTKKEIVEYMSHHFKGVKVSAAQKHPEKFELIFT